MRKIFANVSQNLENMCGRVIIENPWEGYVDLNFEGGWLGK